MRTTLMVDDKKLDIGQLDQAPALLVGDTDAAEFFARRNRKPAHAARMSAATMKLGQALESTYGKHTGLLALRMKAGLSQTELAQRMGTHQPSIARWERAPMSKSGQNMKSLKHPNLQCIYCDDIRDEVGGKTTIVGWYVGVPVSLPEEGAERQA
jgi:DNA-binding transcriptional regulator YiaG